MDCLPKLMARKFEWVENVSMLRVWMILISILLVCPFLAVVLIKIDISLLLFVCGIYFSFYWVYFTLNTIRQKLCY